MTLDPKFWLDLVQWVFMGGLAVLMWARKPGEDANRELREVLTEMGRVQIEMARVQERLAQHESRILNGMELQERRIGRLEDFFMDHFKDRSC
jgi:hypothetical protein